MPDVPILQCTQCTWHGPATSRIDTQAQGNEDWIYPACPKCGNDEFKTYNETPETNGSTTQNKN